MEHNDSFSGEVSPSLPGMDDNIEDLADKLYFQDNLALMDDLISHNVIEPDESRGFTPAGSLRP